MSTRSEIVEGVAEILWAEGWILHVEEHGCENVSGRDILDVMPKIPKEAYEFADKWVKDVEKGNGEKVDALYEKAIEANVAEGRRGTENLVRSSPIAFGQDLAHMMMGAGVSWFDDNAEFDLEVPRHEGGSEIYDLMYLAGSKCKAAWENPPCPECGAFNRANSKKCANCGEKLPEEDEER